MIGGRLSHYEILRLLGRGGSGDVYLARDARDQRLVALKLIGSAAAGDPLAQKRFIREVRSSIRLDHPAIAGLHDVDVFEGRLYLAMEHVEGATLSERLENGPLSVRDSVRVAGCMADALEYAHGLGFVHRDIKPSNIMVTPAGSAKLLDLGLMRHEGSVLITNKGVISGTTCYLSPEQARGQDTDARTDVWSLGVVLYECLAGRRPFEGEGFLKTAYLLLHEPPPDLRRFCPEVPDRLNEVVLRCLEKDRVRRYGSAGDLAADLRGL